MGRNTSRAFGARNELGTLCGIVMITLTGCGAGGDASAGGGSAARPASNVQLVDACELIMQARLESIMGPGQDHAPRSMNSGFDDDSATKYSSCAYTGANESILLKLTYPYWNDPSTSGEWATTVHEDYIRSIEQSDDPDLTPLLTGVKTYPLEGLGSAAAWIDVREFFGQVILHAIKDGSQRTHLELYASDLETGRQVTEKLLAALP